MSKDDGSSVALKTQNDLGDECDLAQDVLDLPGRPINKIGNGDIRRFEKGSWTKSADVKAAADRQSGFGRHDVDHVGLGRDVRDARVNAEFDDHILDPQWGLADPRA
jgi:hypothetical protein